MKGLRKYIARHGHHFTVKLAMKVIECKWNQSEVQSAADRIVYYNVSEATIGDMVFLVNLFSDSFSKGRCIKYALEIIGNVHKNGYAFNAWLSSHEDIDLTEYI